MFTYLWSLCVSDPISMSIKNTLVQVKNDLVCTDYIVDVVNSSNIFPKDRRSQVLSSKMPSLTKKQVRLWNLAEQYIIHIYIYTVYTCKIISYIIYILSHIKSYCECVCVATGNSPPYRENHLILPGPSSVPSGIV